MMGRNKREACTLKEKKTAQSLPTSRQTQDGSFAYKSKIALIVVWNPLF